MQKQYITDPEDGAQYHPAVRDYEIPTQKKLISRWKKLYYGIAHVMNIHPILFWF